ncbi:hypothetical protein KIPB_007305, partial [Kipferlia bialata]
ESISTLHFARRAGKIVNRAVINEVLSEEDKLNRLESDNATLRKRVAELEGLLAGKRPASSSGAVRPPKAKRIAVLKDESAEAVEVVSEASETEGSSSGSGASEAESIIEIEEEPEVEFSDSESDAKGPAAQAKAIDFEGVGPLGEDTIQIGGLAQFEGLDHLGGEGSQFEGLAGEGAHFEGLGGEGEDDLAMRIMAEVDAETAGMGDMSEDSDDGAGFPDFSAGNMTIDLSSMKGVRYTTANAALEAQVASLTQRLEEKDKESQQERETFSVKLDEQRFTFSAKLDELETQRQ